MSLIKCPECGGEWFRQEMLLEFSADVFDEGGEPEMADYRNIYRCIPCDTILDLSLYRQEQAALNAEV